MPRTPERAFGKVRSSNPKQNNNRNHEIRTASISGPPQPESGCGLLVMRLSPGLAWGIEPRRRRVSGADTEGHTEPGLLSTPGSLRISNHQPESHVPPGKSAGSSQRTLVHPLRSVSATAEYRDRPPWWSSALQGLSWPPWSSAAP